MKRIKEYKISLMEKENKQNTEDKNIYIIKATATFDIEQIFEKYSLDQKEFILNSAETAFKELINLTKDNKIDSLGVWFTFDDMTKVDNAISLSILNDIKKYGSQDIEPVKEFIKMTLEII